MPEHPLSPLASSRKKKKKKWVESLSPCLQDDWWPGLRIARGKIGYGPEIQISKSMQVQQRTLWTHQFASGSSIAACTWRLAHANIPCPLCVWTWLFCFQAWFGSSSRTSLLVLGLTQEEWICLQLAVWTGFQRTSLAPGWEPAMQNPLPRHSKAFYPEGNACLCRVEHIPFKGLIQVSGTNSHRKRNVKKKACVVLSITCRSSNPPFC